MTGDTAAKIQIVVLAADPSATGERASGEEKRAIEGKIRESRYRDRLALKTRSAVRPDDLVPSLLEDEPAVIHFIGRGAEDGAGLEFRADTADASRPVSGDTLANVIRAVDQGQQIRIVVLNAGYSEAQARAIARVVDCAVGIRAAVSPDAARAFAATFYLTLGHGRSVQNAFDVALAAIPLHGIAADGIELFEREPGVAASTALIERMDTTPAPPSRPASPAPTPAEPAQTAAAQTATAQAASSRPAPWRTAALVVALGLVVAAPAWLIAARPGCGDTPTAAMPPDAALAPDSTSAAPAPDAAPPDAARDAAPRDANKPTPEPRPRKRPQPRQPPRVTSPVPTNTGQPPRCKPGTFQVRAKDHDGGLPDYDALLPQCGRTLPVERATRQAADTWRWEYEVFDNAGQRWKVVCTCQNG